MGRLFQLRDRINAMNTDDLIQTVMEESIEDLADKNREQMYDGKTKEGKDIGPTYLEDPYFKSPESAQRYSDWKDEITPSSVRKKGVPNLYIIGTYHESIKAVLAGDRIDFSASFPDAPDIERTYEKIYGLGGHYKKEFIEESIRPKMKRGITAATGLKFGK